MNFRLRHLVLKKRNPATLCNIQEVVMGNGSSSLLFKVKVIVLWLVSNSHEVMTAFVVVEISLQVSGYIFFATSAFLSF